MRIIMEISEAQLWFRGILQSWRGKLPKKKTFRSWLEKLRLFCQTLKWFIAKDLIGRKGTEQFLNVSIIEWRNQIQKLVIVQQQTWVWTSSSSSCYQIAVLLRRWFLQKLKITALCWLAQIIFLVRQSFVSSNFTRNFRLRYVACDAFGEKLAFHSIQNGTNLLSQLWWMWNFFSRKLSGDNFACEKFLCAVWAQLQVNQFTLKLSKVCIKLKKFETWELLRLLLIVNYSFYKRMFASSYHFLL